MHAKNKPLPQVPARIEQELIDAVNKIRKAKGQTWNGFIKELFQKEIKRAKL